MAKYKNYDYSQSILIPVSLEDQLMPGTLEFVIHTLVERRMHISVFNVKYQNDETSHRAYDPKILLRVVLLINHVHPFLSIHPTHYHHNVIYTFLE